MTPVQDALDDVVVVDDVGSIQGRCRCRRRRRAVRGNAAEAD